LSVTLVELRQGGHRISVFASRLPVALQWLGHQLPGFAPVSRSGSASPATRTIVSAASRAAGR